MNSLNHRSQLAVLPALAALLFVATSHLAAQSSGFNANEGTAISGSTGYDTMWADSTAHHWLMTNNSSSVTSLVTAWPCTSAGCIPISGSSLVGGYYRETQLSFPTGGPGIPLLSGTSLPQWGAQPGSTGVYALDLQTGNYGLALATEVPNSSGTNPGTTVNLLAKIISGTNGGAAVAGTSDTSVPTYIVVAGAGTTNNAQLAIDGQASCKMDAAVSANSQGYYIVASTTTAGECSAQYSTLSSIPFGTWIVGQLITSGSITSGSLGQILVHPGYRSFASISGLSNSAGTTLVTLNGSTNNNHPAAWNSSGDLVDNQSPVMASPTMTTQSAGDNSTKGATTAYVRQEIQMTWSCHLSSVTSGTNTSCQWTLPAGMTFTQFEIHVANTGSTCSTVPIVSLWDVTASAIVGSYSVSVTNGTATFTVVTGSQTVNSGHVIAVKPSTAGVGCSPAPAGIDTTATYQMTN